MTERRIPLLELRDADGVTVWSECVALEMPNYSAEAIDTAWYALCEWVAPRIIGHDFAHPSEVSVALDVDFRGNWMAKACR
jgi:O-succinylbenzoate synthase